MTTPTFLLLDDMEEIQELVKDIVAAEEVVVLDVRGDGNKSPLKVVIDSEIPVSVDLLARINRLIRDAEEIERRFPQGLRLEVTSPGIDVPLTLPFQFRKNINRKLNVRFSDQDQEKEITGKLISVNEQGIDMDLPRQEYLFIPFEKIIQAKTLISF